MKLLALSPTMTSYRVEAYAVEALTCGSGGPNNPTDFEIVGHSLKKVVERSGCWHKSAIMAVPASAVIIKMLRFPADLNNDELENRVELEVDRFIPYSLDEVNLDFEVLGCIQDCPEVVDVLLAACRKEKVAALEVGGLQAEVVGVESFVLDNTLPSDQGSVFSGQRDFGDRSRKSSRENSKKW